MAEIRVFRKDEVPWGPPLPERVSDDPVDDPERLDRAPASPDQALAGIDDPAAREVVLRRARAGRKAASNRLTAEGVREMTAIRCWR